MGDPTGMKIIAGKFTGVSATVTDSRLVVGLVDGGNISVAVVRDDSATSARWPPSPAATSRCHRDARSRRSHHRDRCTTGMVLSTFDSQWPGGQRAARAQRPTGMTTTRTATTRWSRGHGDR